MLKFYFFLLIFSICLFTNLTASAHWGTVYSGCQSPGGYIYTDEDGSVSGKPNYKFDNVSDRWLTPGDVYCKVYSGSNSCYITVSRYSDAYDDGYRSAWGTYVSFQWVECPIDDYIPLMIIGFAGIGFFAIRKGLIFG